MPETIRFAFAESALGRMLVAVSDAGVCFATFGESDAAARDALAARFPSAMLVEVQAAVLPEAAAVAALATEPSGPLPDLDLRGTDFQRGVWAALLEIPAGSTITYGELAARVGRPSAFRAAATACGANPVALAVPCHRVVGASGALSGYRWGVERKRALLESERR
ncbi:MAG TPA: methylated-DNA--[protein]-cysteine S-methyltransferase [Coriobacteriia bacterium]|nr:methylated-DNA--[protein]-cysteine S-methyltransferase [Coriobacteriia bacterium]